MKTFTKNLTRIRLHNVMNTCKKKFHNGFIIYPYRTINYAKELPRFTYFVIQKMSSIVSQIVTFKNVYDLCTYINSVHRTKNANINWTMSMKLNQYFELFIYMKIIPNRLLSCLRPCYCSCLKGSFISPGPYVIKSDLY